MGSLENALTVAKPTTSLIRSEGSFLAEEMNNRLALDDGAKTSQTDSTSRQLLEQIFTVLLKHIQSRQTK